MDHTKWGRRFESRRPEYADFALEAAVRCLFYGNVFTTPSTHEGVAVVPEHVFYEVPLVDCVGGRQPGDILDLYLQ